MYEHSFIYSFIMRTYTQKYTVLLGQKSGYMRIFVHNVIRVYECRCV